MNNLNLEDELIYKLEKHGYTSFTPIQELAIPQILKGEDIIGLAQTGSGKTLAYSLPIIEEIKAIKEEKKQIKALILCPTRELAMQVKNVISEFIPNNMRVDAIVGGVRQEYQIRSIKKGIDILVATPGRLNDLINQRKITLGFVESIVLDEADTMLDMGFIKDIKTIMSKLRGKKQTLMFSATMSKDIMELTNEFMNDPIKIEIKLTDAEKPKIEEKLYFIDKSNKKDFILKYISENRVEQAIIFVKTKHGADKLGKFMNDYAMNAEVIHGDKRQRERDRSLRNFKLGKAKYLIATDIAARGLDIKSLPHVINYELPDQAEVYIHRIGRTGRAGQTGVAVSFCDKTEITFLKNIQKLIKRDLPVVKDDKYSIDIKIYDRKENTPNNRGKSAFNRNKNSNRHHRR